MNYSAQKENVIDVSVWLYDAEHRGAQGVKHDIRVIVQDVNDEAPKFTKETYDVAVSEHTPVGSVIFDNINIKDVDTVNPQFISVKCDANPKKPKTVQACEQFSVIRNVSNNKQWIGKLVLNKSLDYEKKTIWQVPLISDDGKNSFSQSFEIQVIDIQDSPPIIISSTSKIVKDGFPARKYLLTVIAEDGDKFAPRKIRYEIMSNPGGLFEIDPNSGNITTLQILDREKPILANGYVSIDVKAREVVNASLGIYGNDRSNTATGTVIVTVLDENDNPPLWAPRTYKTEVNEDIASNVMVPNLLLSVEDRDQGNNGKYKIELLNHRDRFSIDPTEGQSLTTVGVKVINSFDYEKNDREFILKIKAQEHLTTEKRSDTATVTIAIQDVNDNVPVFDKNEYIASVLETRPPGYSITTIQAVDADSGTFGSTGIQYSLIGNGAEKFHVNTISGLITVANCPTPGSGNCIDYEQTRTYLLNFVATDHSGTGQTVSKPLVINILDANDNTPQCEIPKYVGFIREQESLPNPPLQVKAVDLDSERDGNNRIRYTIDGGNGKNLFQISETSGLISAKLPIDFESTPGGLGVYHLTIKVSDAEPKSDTCQVIINVQDVNDHRPNFIPSNVYVKDISENTPGKTFILNVTATDLDPPRSSNGDVSYRIESGSLGKFVIDQKSGEIRTANEATFDYDSRKQYILTVIGSDAGQPQLSATAKVTINILDVNNKNPYFEKSVVRVRIYENATVNTNLINVTAKDLDSGAVIRYSIEPTSAYNKGGDLVDPNSYDYKNLFKIDDITGQISTNSRLNYDKAVEVYLQVQAQDKNVTQQTGTGTVVVVILDINEIPPVFSDPWTLSLPHYNITLREEMPTPSFVMTAVASDKDGVITSYNMLKDPGNFFKVDSATGVVTSHKRIDYETIQTLQFEMTAKDSGQPTLTATATVFITIENINDITPQFKEKEYLSSIYEHSPGGTYVTTVNATDLDFGDFGLVRYTLLDQKTNFTIDNMTGVVRVKNGVILDRETTPLITTQAEVYDSPNTPSVRKRTTVPIYVTLKDINDNKPVFKDAEYFATIIETTPVHYSVLKLRAADNDEGINADLRYTKFWGDPSYLFDLNSKTGLISVNETLNGKTGTYKMIVRATDLQGNSSGLWQSANVTIKVIAANNGAPRWIRPPFNNWTITVLENQYLGMLIYQVLAIDDDEGPSGQITYGFMYGDTFVSATPEFRINPITGVIRAEQVYDREFIDTYTLLLVAKDSGDTPFETSRFLTVKILDVDDNQPEFPRYKNGSVKPYDFTVLENATVGSLIGILKATDKDLENYASIYYHIVYGNEGDNFELEKTSGKLNLKKSLDREVKRQYILEVRATNMINPQNFKLITRKRRSAIVQPSTVTVKITIDDINDNVPKFQYASYSACVSVNDAAGKSVLTMRAYDLDAGEAGKIKYQLTRVRNFKDRLGSSDPEAFYIGENSGMIYLKKEMTGYQNTYFRLEMRASNPGQSNSDSATASIYVTQPTETVKVLINRSPSKVNSYLQDYINVLSKAMDNGMVCVSDLRFHAGDDNKIHLDQTDLHYHVINPDSGQIYPAEEVKEKANENLQSTLRGDFAILYISKFSVVKLTDNSWRYQPLLIMMIIILCILLITAILLVIACCFFQKSYRRKMRNAKSAPTLTHDSPQRNSKNPLLDDPLQIDSLKQQKVITVGYTNSAFEPDSAPVAVVQSFPPPAGDYDETEYRIVTSLN
ncbi:cadherin-87A-like isoform X2 [Tubulanus polymorphus]|uniref:cadherin-87A-like isoform X2 n=1 Tax=Tubulanus polymorphus TaxID=672921 RepID=UPI003DA3295E